MGDVEKRIAIKKRLGYNLPTKNEFFDLPDLKEKTIFDEIDRSLNVLKKENEKRDQLEDSHYLELKLECKRLAEKMRVME